MRRSLRLFTKATSRPDFTSLSNFEFHARPYNIMGGELFKGSEENLITFHSTEQQRRLITQRFLGTMYKHKRTLITVICGLAPHETAQDKVSPNEKFPMLSLFTLDKATIAKLDDYGFKTFLNKDGIRVPCQSWGLVDRQGQVRLSSQTINLDEIADALENVEGISYESLEGPRM